MGSLLFKYKKDFGFNLAYLSRFFFFINSARGARLNFWFNFLDKKLLGLETFWWFEFEFIGYQYSLKFYKRKNILEVDLGYTFNSRIRFSKNIKFKRKRRQFVFFGIDKFQIMWLANYIKLYHVFPPFKIKGFIFHERKNKFGYFFFRRPKGRKNEILTKFFLSTKIRGRFF